MEHSCKKESDLAELRQLVRSFGSNEERTYQNWHDIKALEVQKERIDKEQKEILDLIKDISECQTKLIKEIVKINTTFTTMKYLMGIFFTVFGGIVCFLVTELIKII